MMTEIIRKVAVINRTSDITNEQVLSWPKTVEAHRPQNAILDTTKKSRIFNMAKKQVIMKWHKQHKEIL